MTRVGQGTRAVVLALASLMGMLACTKTEPAAAVAPTGFTVVDVDATSSPAFQLAVQACAGLHNRQRGGSVYVRASDHDAVWLDELALKPEATVPDADFLNTCLATFPACVRYDYKTQQTLLPSILTAAVALDAVPLDAGLTVTCGQVALDAQTVFHDLNTPYLATKYVFEHYAKSTTGLAMLNPGFDTGPDNPANPKVNHDMGPALVDYVFSRKLFVVFLTNGCIEGNPERELLSAIVNAGNWSTPLGVYGYNNSWNVGGGDLYEAQTRCLDSRNMGAIASETANLSFFSTRRAPMVAAHEVEQNPLEQVTYDPQKTYVAFVVGDGDNIAYMMSTRHDWFRQRLTACTTGDKACPPLSWSISPHLAQLAPDLLQWYYAIAQQTGHDYFTLPPSGHLYAYPASLAAADQDKFVAATENDARILGITGTVHWEMIGSWDDAEFKFLPKYAHAEGTIRGIFPVNVPYMLPMFDAWPAEQFSEILTGADGTKVALFRPREWRGITKEDDPFFLTPDAMAAEIAAYPKGTVTWVYMTSDGGLALDNAFLAVAKKLPPHVQLVSTDTAAKLAIAAH